MLRSMLTRTVGLQVSFVVEEDDAAFGAHDTKRRAFFSACITLTLGVMGRWVWRFQQHSRLADQCRRWRVSCDMSADATMTPPQARQHLKVAALHSSAVP